MKKEIEKILGIYYVSPHVSIDGKKWNERPCGDCFCTLQEVHTHNDGEELVQPLLDLFKKYKNL